MNLQNWRRPAGFGLLGLALVLVMVFGVNMLGHKAAPLPLPKPHLTNPAAVKPKVPLPRPAPHKQVPKPKPQVQKQHITSAKPVTPSGCFPVCPLNINPWAQ